MTATENYSISDVLARIDEERTWWDDVLARGNEEAMLEPGLSADWSFRDVVDHLNFWSGRTLDRLYATRNGSEPYVEPFPAEIDRIADEDERTDAINGWWQERTKDVPLSEVIDVSRSNINRIHEFVGMTSAEDLNNPAAFPSLKGTSLGESIMSGAFFEHVHDEHGAAIQKWLDQA
jgi:hypothetical protein